MSEMHCEDHCIVVLNSMDKIMSRICSFRKVKITGKIFRFKKIKILTFKWFLLMTVSDYTKRFAE